MKNDFYDLSYVCGMIERVARHLKQRNDYVVNKIGTKELDKRLNVANVEHSVNPRQVVQEWIERYDLALGNYDVSQTNKLQSEKIPSPMIMGDVYARIILGTRSDDEGFADGIVRVYNNKLSRIIDDYDNGAYCEPSCYLVEAFQKQGF